MNIALILAGGTGECYGFSRPRQYIWVKEKMIINHCLQVFGAHPKINAIYVVAHEEWRKEIVKGMSDAVLLKFKGFCLPGANRQRSIFQGLNDMAGFARKDDIVVIHDAIRPVVSASQISACLNACKEHDGAVPVLPIWDTVYFGENGTITSQADRNKIFVGQTPEAYVLGKYYKANSKLMPKKIDKIRKSPEPAVMAGMNLAMVPGDEDNFDIMTRVDLERYRQLMGRDWVPDPPLRFIQKS